MELQRLECWKKTFWNKINGVYALHLYSDGDIINYLLLFFVVSSFIRVSLQTFDVKIYVANILILEHYNAIQLQSLILVTIYNLFP